MIKKISNYIVFLSNIIFSKKLTWLSLIIFLLLNVVMCVILGFFQGSLNNFSPIYIVVFIQILFTIFYSSLIYINTFRELEEEGIEILSLSKAISRNNIYLGKTLFCLIFSLIFGLIFSSFNTFFCSIVDSSWNLLTLFLYSFIAFFAVFNFFGVIASLIAYKFNSKLAMTIPYLFSIPTILGGIIINYNSTSVANNMAYYLDLKYENNLSGNLANSQYFYLKNNKDNFYIVPNGYQKSKFSEKQNEYILSAYDASKNSSKEISWYSYLVIPYQFLDIFNNQKHNSKINNLKDSINYPNLDSYLYNYKLVKNVDLFNYENDTEKVYIIPGLLKNQTLRENIINTNIIYARENANSFAIEFPEDKYVFSASDNLVGEVKWSYVLEVLNDPYFQNYANNLFAKINESIDGDTDLNYSQTKVIQAIEEELANEESFLNKYESSFVTVFDSKMIDNKVIKTLTEKKVYLASSLLYYAYFNFNDSYLVKAILVNPNQENTYAPSQFKININNYSYLIGGYSSYTPMQEVQGSDENKKVVIRYNLSESENYLFQPVSEIYELQRTQPIIIKEIYFVIWIGLIALLLALNGYKYAKKDYK